MDARAAPSSEYAIFKDKQKKKKREENEIQNAKKKKDQALTSATMYVLTMMPELEAFKRIRRAMRLKKGGKMVESFMSDKVALPEATPPVVPAKPEPVKPVDRITFKLWSEERETRKRKEKMMKRKYMKMKRSLKNALLYWMEMESRDEMVENRKYMMRAIMEIRKNIGGSGDKPSNRDIVDKILSLIIRMDRRSR
jgi:hypothetical protein